MSSPRVRAESRRYLIRFGAAMAAYVLVVVVSASIVNANPDAPWRFVVAATPLIPAIVAGVVVLRHVSGLDELERRIQLEAVAFAAVGGGLATFTYGFVELAGAPSIPMVWDLPLLIVLGGVGGGIARARYR